MSQAAGHHVAGVDDPGPAPPTLRWVQRGGPCACQCESIVYHPSISLPATPLVRFIAPWIPLSPFGTLCGDCGHKLVCGAAFDKQRCGAEQGEVGKHILSHR